MTLYCIIYLFLMSILLFVIMGIDKYRAKHFKWRIPESTLFTFAVMGGALGGCLGMILFRHKTRHRRFIWLFPVLAVIHIAIVVVLAYI